MTVRARFVCSGVHAFPSSRETDGGRHEACVASKVSLTAVYQSPPADSKDRGNAVQENRIFGRATPHGSLEMTIMVEEVAAQFKPGKAYYLDFTPAD